ncbi:hypothetical protein CFC21_072566 [Triticum aestivum]|uniref:Uncharacterized protein n=2 Tax=Triticum aestivum TaxID=4565 RepID=A0A3B6LNU2_WHEAT|nr:argininosuccinate lyase, chloroplastic-like [Triticum dicoccoides]XP_044389691.1 argininosuccinate lyase, chloroplastic-like isoform X1 [Triticum aestivum]XP_044389692.1 argininosuccinate lyase, chloroplastic-like isoform X1 [Triticum aestivum]KAF7066613.1 hypothetical protein CFC21_072566 [Triticum aestivum]
MAAFAAKGSLRGGCFTASGLSGKNPPPSNSFCNHFVPSRSNAVPSMAWGMGCDRRQVKLKAQVPKWVLLNDDYLYDDQALQIDTIVSSSAVYIDLLNRERYRDPVLGRTKPEVTYQHKQRLEADEKRLRDLVDGLVESISSDSKNYRYVIMSIKENANMIMEEGFISSYARDEILEGLERIEKDIEVGKFHWRNNKDIRSNIVEALIDIVEGPAKRLDAVISRYAQILTVLQIWCHDSIDKFVAQIKELQVELVLLAIRNEGLVLPCTARNADCILLGDLVLSKVEQLENDVSQLVSCKNKIGSTLQTSFLSGRTDDSMNSLSKGSLHHICNSILKFGNLIVGDIAHDVTDLEQDLHSWMRMLTQNDEVTQSLLLMWRHQIDLDIFNVIQSSGSIYNADVDSSKRFLKACKVVPEMIRAARGFVKHTSFNHEKIQSFPPKSFLDAPQLAGFRSAKDLDHGAGAAAKQDFKFHSDHTTGRLLGWLRRLHQSGQNS